MARLLTDFLRDMAGRPFQWGQTDCALMMAEWVSLRRGVPVAEDLRGSYATEDECQRILDDRGGLLRVVSGIASSVPLRLTSDPKPGDIGIVRCPPSAPTCAIKVRRGWALKTPTGLIVMPAPVIRAWKVC